MHVPLWIWIIAITLTLVAFAFDFISHVRKPHEPSAREATLWTLFYVGCSLAVMVAIGLLWDWDHAGQYLGGYATELALSLDNLFVFLIIMTSFAVPPRAQQKALLFGIAIALALRAIFIVAGVTILEHFSWVFFLFGAWLAYIAVKQAIESFSDDEPEIPGWVGTVRRVIHTSEHYEGDRLTVRHAGRRALTPLALVVVALGVTDLLFALDSIPAIFAITQEAFIVFLANALALMGLRQLYFLIGKLMDRLVFLDLGLAFILGFIAVKLVFHAMHVNELPFLNGGQPIEWAPEIPIWFSLLYIFGVLAIATIASLVYSGARNDGATAEAVVADGDVAGAESATVEAAAIEAAAAEGQAQEGEATDATTATMRSGADDADDAPERAR